MQAEDQPMTVYAVFLNEPSSDAWQALRKEWPNGRHFILTDHMAFVAPEGLTLTSDIAETVGISETTKRLGIVFEWVTHNGFNRSDLWEWLLKVRT